MWQTGARARPRPIWPPPGRPLATKDENPPVRRASKETTPIVLSPESRSSPATGGDTYEERLMGTKEAKMPGSTDVAAGAAEACASLIANLIREASMNEVTGDSGEQCSEFGKYLRRIG